jgi:hypothetical protein
LYLFLKNAKVFLILNKNENKEGKMEKPIIVQGKVIEEGFVIAPMKKGEENKHVSIAYHFISPDEVAITVCNTTKEEIVPKRLISFLLYHQILKGEWEMKESQDAEEIFTDTFEKAKEPFTSISLSRVVPL